MYIPQTHFVTPEPFTCDCRCHCERISQSSH